ncbi:MAG: PHP domain-containing protein [Planctomycetes bacterium]|nr:PHP domain-containing protein [Planctomycetota bacterium]
MRIDLHLHSSLSDGAFVPEDVVRFAHKTGLETVALSDHDSISAFARAEAVLPAGMRLLRGVELSSRFEGTEFHILGYFPSDVGDSFRAYLSEAQRSRRERMAEGIIALRARGLSVTIEEITSRFPGSESVSRSHVAQYLVDTDQVPSLAEAFERHLKYTLDVIPRTRLSSEGAIALILEHGGLPVWAHPSIEAFDAHVRTLAAAGLRGVEIYTRRRPGGEAAFCEKTCDELGLLATAGSDWHGNGRRPRFIPLNYDDARLEEFLSHFPAAAGTRRTGAVALAAPQTP